MLATRVIPCLLLRGDGLYKTERFTNPKYVGDPLNAVRIFNDKEVDEIVVLDITATVEGKGPSLELLRDIASEAFMPMCYGGGIRTLTDVRGLFNLGIEKVALNTATIEEPAVVRDAADVFGTQSIVVSMDVRRSRRHGNRVYARSGTIQTELDPLAHAVRMQEAGAGELLVTSIDRDGTQKGYDLELVQRIAAGVDIPVIANGGAGRLEDFADAARVGASAVAAGSMFVFHGRHRAVLISYPSEAERSRVLA